MTPGMTASSRLEGQASDGTTKRTPTGALAELTWYPAYPGLLPITVARRAPGTMPCGDPGPAIGPLRAPSARSLRNPVSGLESPKPRRPLPNCPGPAPTRSRAANAGAACAGGAIDSQPTTTARETKDSARIHLIRATPQRAAALSAAKCANNREASPP